MSKKEMNCPKCLRYAKDGATEHHQYCPIISDNSEQAKKDYDRGWLAYCGGTSESPYHIKRANLLPEDTENPYFMLGYNVAFLVDDDAQGGVEDLHINKLEE